MQKSIFKNLFSGLTVGLCLAVSLSGSTAGAAAGWLQQVRPLADAQVINTPDGNHDVIVKAIGLAKTSVEMWMYHLTDPNVIQALIDAQNRNVNVQVILDRSSLRSAKYMDIFKQLQTARVNVVESSAQFNLTHTKTFVIDKTLAFVSTMNLVGHFQDMRDFGLFTEDADLVRELETVFAADLENAQNNTGTTPPLSNPNLVWSPVNSEQKLTDLIDSAQTSIALTVENLGQTEILDALLRAQSRGVHVQVITPKCDLNSNPVWNYPFLYSLQKGGVDIHVMPNPSSPNTPYMHAKTIVVDGRTAYLGSENFSQNSLRNSRETGVIFGNPIGIGKITAVFQRDWQAAEILPATPPTCPKSFDTGTGTGNGTGTPPTPH